MQKNEPIQSTKRAEIKEIHLRDYLSVLKKRQITVFTFFAITLLLALIITFSMTPLYTASSEVLIEENYGGDNNIEGTYIYKRYNQEFFNTQFKIIASSNVVERVVKQLKLDTKYRDYFLKEESDHFAFLLPLKMKIYNLFSYFSHAEPTINIKDSAESILLIGDKPTTDLENIIKSIQENLQIKPEIDTKIVKIKFSHRQAGMSKLVVDFIVNAYKAELQEIKHSSSSDSLKWMTEKAEEERDKLEGSELALQNYMRDNDIITVENKLAIYPQKLSEFSSQLSIAQVARKKLESNYNLIKLALEESRDLETIPLFADNLVLQALRGKIYLAEQNIKNHSKTYGYKNPVMIKAKEELINLKKEKQSVIDRIIEATKNSYDLAVTQEKNVAALLSSTKNELLNLNEKFVQFSIMKREVNTNSILYDTLTASLKKASVTEQSQSVNVWVLNESTLPQYPSQPKKMLNILIGVVVGLFGGVIIAFFIEYLDNTVKSSKEIEQRFGIPVLGAIEELRGKDQKIESFVLEHPLSPFAESYRLIRSSILLSSVDRPPCSILFTSMAPSEGKSSTTVNVARILSQSEKKVLIIDCDMRKPSQHSILSLSNSVGLSSYLSGNTKENIVQHIEKENIFVITAGPIPPNPAELLDSTKMKTLMERMADIFDFVLLDSPPIYSVTDSLSLATLVEGTIIVVRAGKTTYDMIENGVSKFNAIQAQLLGFVLNGVNPATGSDTYYHGYYKYYTKDDQEAV